MVTQDIRYIGVDDKTLDLFEGQYAIPNGVAYNSYLILDEKVAVMDTVDKRRTAEYLDNLERELAGRSPDYLVITHVEPDHASSIRALVDKYPGIRLVGNAKTFQMLPQYFDLDLSGAVTVKEGDLLSLGRHELSFLMAPMVHWPEVMVAYDSCDKVLFSADAFGKFGALDAEEDWACEARRYYFNIVGKYGPQVQALLKKAAALDIRVICPLHGPVLKEDLGYYLGKYDVWSSYGVEQEGVFIAYASLHGNTAGAAARLAELLRDKGCPSVAVADLARDDMSEALEDAFKYGKVVLAASSYNAGVMPFMEDFLHHLKAKNYQKRTVALIENGSWAPSAARTMREILSQMKEIEIVEPVVTIRGAVKQGDLEALETLAAALLG
ncbi:FprA family A-type flavoprotein [Anaerofilum sp. BX8]|uniref:FprA family A-type flavoprotein n=1 Tax=Anaerofilum hominis TaxID=2763016 RepID=A0A923L2D9_9FIRM|nr:FprA family A-type flavoprotein [Anaerofilum hominis]MBC5582531.1 FprA family A-type flavoprotein [Anaerofilum hominis]